MSLIIPVMDRDFWSRKFQDLFFTSRTPVFGRPRVKTNMERYERISKLGEGSYGKVYQCRNRVTEQIVAVKIFIQTEEQEVIRKVALREIQMLKLLKHPNLINLIEIFRRKKKLHLVFEYCELTLLNEMEKNPSGYPHDGTKKIVYQLLQALKYCHSKHVIHRDVKPENILLTKDGVVKLCDFGFARTLGPADGNLTDYVATRWYRAPELLVGDLTYGPAVDVWALGCVMAELIKGQALWPGRSDLDQLYQIKSTLGDLIPKHIRTFDNNEWYNGTKIQEPLTITPLKMRMPANFPQDGVDFLEKCLDKDPEQRWTCEQLLSHDYFSGFSYRLPRHELEKFHVINKASNYSNSVSLPQLAVSSNSAQGSYSTASSPDLRPFNQYRSPNQFQQLPNI